MPLFVWQLLLPSFFHYHLPLSLLVITTRFKELHLLLFDFFGCFSAAEDCCFSCLEYPYVKPAFPIRGAKLWWPLISVHWARNSLISHCNLLYQYVFGPRVVQASSSRCSKKLTVCRKSLAMLPQLLPSSVFLSYSTQALSSLLPPRNEILAWD